MADTSQFRNYTTRYDPGMGLDLICDALNLGLYIGVDAAADASPTISSAIIKFLQSGTGAIARTVQDQLRENEVSLFQFIPTSLQAAITAGTSATDVSSYCVSAVTEAGSRTVYAPPGRYCFSSSVTWKRLRGAGSNQVTFKKIADTVIAKFLSNQWSCEGIYFSGNYDTDLTNIVAFTDTTDNVVIGANDGAGGTGAGYVNAQDGETNDFLSQGAGQYGINWQEGQNQHFKNTRCRLNHSHGLYVSPNAFDASLATGDLHLSYNGGDGFHSEFGTHDLNIISNNNTGKGIYFQNATGLEGALYSENNTGTGIHLDTACSNCRVNILHNNDSWTDSGTLNTVIYKGTIYLNVAVQNGDGTASTPSYTFSGETALGFFRPGTGIIDIGFANLSVFRFNMNAGQVILSSGHQLGFSSAASAGSTPDTLLNRDAAAVLALKNGTTAQEFRVYGNATGSKYASVKHDGTNALITTTAGQVAFGSSALATNATTGFMCIPSCAGIPTGTPASIPTGQLPIVYDSTNNNFYVYNGAWKKVALA